MDKDTIEKINLEPKAKKKSKWLMVGKFLKDAGHFIFNEDKASDEVRKDLLSLEAKRAEEKMAERVAKSIAEAKAKQKLEDEKKLTETESQKRFLESKLKTADRFKKERDDLLKHKQTVANHLINEKKVHKTPSGHGFFGFFNFFKKHPKASLPPKTDIKEAQDSLPDSRQIEDILNNLNKTAEPVKANSLIGRAVVNSQVEAPVNKQDKIPEIKETSKESPKENKPELKLPKEKAAKKFQEERLKHEDSHQRDQIENRKWQSYNIVATNLIREQSSMFLNWQGKMLLLGLFVSLSVFVCILAYGFLLILEKDKINSNKYIFENLESIVVEIKKEEGYAQDILNFNDKLLAVDYLLKNHLYWTNFFKFLEDNTINEVYYESFVGDTTGKYTVPAIAKDFNAISLQLKVLQNATDRVISVDSGGAETAKESIQPTDANSVASSTPNAKVNFLLNLNLNRSLFIKEPEYE